MKKAEKEKIDLQFEKMIKSVMEEQGYFKEENVKSLVNEILLQLEPIIAKHVKNHFYEIGTFIINNINNKPSIVENKDAKASWCY